MKSILRTLAVVAAIAALAPAAQAETSDATVTVKVNLTSKCRIKPGSDSGLAVDFGAYEAFQPGANTGTAAGGPLTVQSTRGFGGTPSATWDGDSAGGGVIAGLSYDLDATAGTRQDGTDATVGDIGSPDKVEFTLTGTMPGGQAGEGNSGAQTATRTLTVSF
jgi:hypothetical protein